MLANPASAIEWKFAPSVGVQATYTDNVNQSHSDPQDALILSVTPGFTLQSQGSRRIQASMSYGLTGVSRFGDDNSTDLNHNLGATGKAELIEDFLFVDGSASISQELISLLGSPADETYSSGNRATVGRYSISPYIKKRFGTFAEAQARYTNSGAFFGNDAASDSTSNAFNASLKSGSRFNDLSWGIDYSIRDAQNRGTGSNDSTFESAHLSLGYALTRKFHVFGTVGEERNDYLSITDTNGRSWSAGFGWSPSRRTSIEASMGERFFGNTYSLAARHRTRSTSWNLSYAEDVSDISAVVVNVVTAYLYLCPGANPGDPPQLIGSSLLALPNPGCILLGRLQGLIPSIANGVFVSKTLSGGVAWSKGKSSLGLNVFDTRRQYQQLVGLPEDETRGVSATYGYRLQPHTSLNASLAFTNNKVPAGLGTQIARDDDIYTVSLGINHQFDPKLSGALTLRHQRRDSNDPTNSFDENSITASASMRF